MTISKEEKPTKKPETRGRKRGGSKSGGRKPGTPNKNSWSLKASLESAGFDPVAEMVLVLRNTTDPDLKFQRLSWLFRYVFPQLKEIEAPISTATPQEPSPAASIPTDKLISLLKK